MSLKRPVLESDLSEDEIICFKCNGYGYTGYSQEIEEMHLVGGRKVHFPSRVEYDFCRVCYGKGKLDWVENARGIAKGYVK